MEDRQGPSTNGRAPLRVIFTDLDGTLLDPRTYACDAAAGALERVTQEGIPLVFCSSKTRAEQEPYRRRLGVDAPFVVEGGAAIFIPEGMFPDAAHPSDDAPRRRVDGYTVVELGLAAPDVRERLVRVRRATGLAFRGYREMALEEVCRETGLEAAAARRTRACEYGERLILDFEPEAWGRFAEALAGEELEGSVAGKYCTVTSAGCDKGRAVRYLCRLYHAACCPVETVGIGDSLNDVPMLEEVDRPYLVQKPGPEWEEMDVAGLRRVEGVASKGWRAAVLDLLGEPAGVEDVARWEDG